MRLSCCYGFLVYVAIVQVGCMFLFPVVEGKLTLEPMDPSLCSSDNVTFFCKGTHLLFNDTVSLYIDNKVVNNISGYKDEFELDYTLSFVAASDHIPAVACVTREERQISMLNVQTEPKFNGTLSPLDKNVCVGENVTFTCTLHSDPKANHSILFFNKTHRDEDIVAVNPADVDVVNASVSKYTVKVTDDKNMVMRCYYSEPDGKKPDLTLRLGFPSTIFSSNESNPVVSDFHCISYNFVDSMNCSWKYSGYSEAKPTVDFNWKIAMFKTWRSCPHLDVENNFCYWQNTNDGDFSMKPINIRLNITYSTCGNRQMTRSYDYDVDTRKIVKPNPVKELTSEAINSTCIEIKWSTSDSRPEYPKTQNISVSSKWGSYFILFDTPAETDYRALHNYRLCDLEEYTVYTVSLTIRYKKGGYWSEAKDTTSQTSSDVPSACPAVVTGGYSWSPPECQNEPYRRTVCYMLQPIDDRDENGDMKGLSVTFTSDSSNKSTNLSEDTLYRCEEHLLCNESYQISFTPYNDAGSASCASYIPVEKWTNGIIQPNLKVEMSNNTTDGNNHTVFLEWSNGHVDGVTGYRVFRCTKAQGGCKYNGAMTWDFYPADTHAVTMTIKNPEALSYGVSLITDSGSSGLQWVTCAYTKDVCPTKSVQNVDVLAGSQDNTLVVTWEKIPCQSGEPFISSYILTYCQVDKGSCKDKILSGKLGRVVLADLEEKQEYEVKVKGVTDEGCSGPYSDPMRGTPEHRALKPGEIGGIITASLIVLILAGIGTFCCIRRSKVRFNIWKKNITAVKLPDLNQNNTLHVYTHDVDYDQTSTNVTHGVDDDQKSTNVIDRQDSNDSGIPETPKEVKNQEFIVHPDGYCKAILSGKGVDCVSTEKETDPVIQHCHNDERIVHNKSQIPPPLNLSHNISKTKETVTKDSGISNDDYKKATIETSISHDASASSRSNYSDSDVGNTFCEASKSPTMDVDDQNINNSIKLTSIPKPIDQSSSSAAFTNDSYAEDDDMSIPDYVKSHDSENQNVHVQNDADTIDIGVDDLTSNTSIKLTSIPKPIDQSSSSSALTNDSYAEDDGMDISDHVKSHDSGNLNVPVQNHADLSNSDPVPDPYVESPLRYGGNLSSSDQDPGSYFRSAVEYAGDLSNSDPVPDAYIDSPVDYDGDLSNSHQVNYSYVKSHVEYGGDPKHSDQINDAYVKSPIVYGGDPSHSDKINDAYVKSPIQYGGDPSHSDQINDAYVKSPIVYGGDPSHSDKINDAYVKSPIQYGGDPSHSDQINDAYVKSPVEYGDDLSNSEPVAGSYVKSPVEYAGDLSNSVQVPDAYVKSPIEYGDGHLSSEPVLGSYVKSHVEYAGDLSNSDQVPDAYVKSPIEYGGDHSSSDPVPGSYVKSPVVYVEYGGDPTSSDPVPDAYVKSPVEYGGDLSSSYPVPDACVKSPIEYGGDSTSSDPVPDSYVKSPVEYGGDLSSSYPVPDASVKSPIEYGGDPTSSDPVPDSYVKSPVQCDDNRSPLPSENVHNDLNNLLMLRTIPVPVSGYSNHDDTSASITKQDNSSTVPSNYRTSIPGNGNHDGSNITSHANHTPTTKITPADYIASDQMEMLKKVENNLSHSDSEPDAVTDDVSVTNKSEPDLTEATQQGYVDIRTIVDGKYTPVTCVTDVSKNMPTSDQLGDTDKSQQVNYSVDNNTDTSLLDTLKQQTSGKTDIEGNKSPCRNMSDASDSSSDSLNMAKLMFEGRNENQHNSDSGLSSLEC